MVLLPIIYVGIIALVAWDVYEHALHPRYRLGGGTLALLGYLAPIIVGGVLVFFMIKPLFARRPKDSEPHSLLPKEEPELFRLIYAVCDTVHAPRPARVLVDFQVNAFAAYRRGLPDLLRRRLTLSIGMPLVAGLSVRQFGGVLAHEFGHFSQGAAMGLTFIVRSVNAWFARVVYERGRVGRPVAQQRGGQRFSNWHHSAPGARDGLGDASDSLAAHGCRPWRQLFHDAADGIRCRPI